MSYVHMRACALLAGACIFCGQTLANSQDYVSAIKADLAEFQSGSFAPPSGSSWTGTTASDDGTGSLADFEKFVKKKFRGSYILFARLPDWHKNKIWQNYLATGDLGGIRSDIYASKSTRQANRSNSSLSNLPLNY